MFLGSCWAIQGLRDILSSGNLIKSPKGQCSTVQKVVESNIFISPLSGTIGGDFVTSSYIEVFERGRFTASIFQNSEFLGVCNTIYLSDIMTPRKVIK